jgi:hypothetical protein
MQSNRDNEFVSTTKKILAFGTSSILLQGLGHPAEVITKRWQNVNVSFSEAIKKPQLLSSIIFQTVDQQSAYQKVRSLYSGYSWSLTNKFAQLFFVIGGQQEFSQQFKDGWFHTQCKRFLGETTGNAFFHGTIGTGLGAVHSIFLPLDIMKIRYIVNPETKKTLKEIGMINYALKEKTSLYKAPILSTFKNSILIGSLLGLNNFIKSSLGITNPTVAQTYAVYGFSTFVITLAANPFDVIKTRIQGMDGDEAKKTTAWKLFKNMLANGDFWKLSMRGSTLKLAYRTGKGALNFGSAELIMHYFDNSAAIEKAIVSSMGMFKAVAQKQPKPLSPFMAEQGFKLSKK